MKKFELWLRMAMDDAGITSYAELGRRIGVSEPTVWRWANGVNEPEESNITEMSKALSVTKGAIYLALGRRAGLDNEQQREALELLAQADPETYQMAMDLIRFRNQQRIRKAERSGQAGPSQADSEPDQGGQE
jgi:transcriptional regulator with XRE-family HTH domain